MATAAPAKTRAMTMQDLFALRFVGEIALSPDGTQIAFTVGQVDGEVNRNRAAIWLAAADGSAEPRQLTSGEKKDTQPRWSPDGTKLAFVSDRGKKGQVYVLDLANGGEAQALTHDDEHGCSAPAWSADGTQIAFLCKVPTYEDVQHVVEYKDDTDKPKVITRPHYKFDGAGFFDHTRNQLFVLPATGGTPKQLTTNPTGVNTPAWSPDGAKIAFVANMAENAERERFADVWTLDVASGATARVTAHDGLYGSPAWSPDSQSLAIIGHPLPRKGGANNRLYIAPATGGKLREVTDFDRSIGSGVMSDTGTDGRSQPIWLDTTLYFLAAMNGTAQVFSVPAAGGEAMQATFGVHAIAGWDIARDGSLLAFGASTPVSPGELFTQPLDRPGEPVEKRTDFTGQSLGEIEVTRAEEFWLTASDGTGDQIQGWILKPPGFDPATKYPLILEIHGGPAGTYGVGWFHEFHAFAAQGYVVVYCNPRGSQGYGEAFCTSIYQDWGTKPMMDVMAAIDYAIGKGYVDTDRLYVTGGSYGGYMTDWIVTHTDRFRAAATQRCVSNVATLALVDDISIPFTSDYFGGAPWEVPEVYTRNSPITYIKDCHTPLFIEHEEEDHRCPIDQAEQVYNALNYLGVETELIRYPKESHGLSRDGGPLHRIDRLTRIVGWFERHK